MKLFSFLGSIIGLIFSLGLFGASYHLDNQIANSAPSDYTIDLPLNKGDWQGEDLEGLGLREQNILRLDQHIRRNYRRSDGAEVFIYIGYWENQSGDHQAAKHSPKTCLPSNGWVIQNTGSRVIDPANDHRVSTITAKFKTKQTHYNYWFFSGTEEFHQEAYALDKIIKNRMLEGRSDGGIVEIATSAESFESKDIEKADEILADFYNNFKEYIRPAGTVAGKPADTA